MPYNSGIPMASRRRSRFGSGLLIALGLAIFVADPALAHNEFVSSSPIDGARLETSPATWDMTFAKEVPLDSASGEIVGPDGTITTLAPPVHGSSTSVISFTLPPGLTGTHTARWRLVSVDGHVISGRVTFAVGTGVDLSGVLADGATTNLDPGDPAPEPVRWALRLFGFVAFMALGGLLVSDLYIVEGVFAALRDRAVLKVIAGALVVVPLLQMLIFLGDVFGTSVLGALSHLADVFDTTPGSMMFVRTVLGGVLCYQLVTVMRGRPTVSEQRLVLAAAGLYAFAQAYTGHSRSRAWPILGIPADTVHLAAASVWLGGLAVLVLLVAPLLDPKDLWRSFERYGRVARLAVIALIVTGVIQTLRLHGGITTLFSQSHGRLLLLKLIVVAIMLRLGDMNRRRIAARMKDNPNLMEKKLREVTKAATVEVATGGVVLAVTAALVTSSFS
ncbi:MAG: copper resistance CopC/CopD family protein [Actinomycetota bacterium]